MTVTVRTGDCRRIMDEYCPDAIVTDPPEAVQRKHGAIERLRERAGGHLGYVGRAENMQADLRNFVVPPERVVVWWPPNSLPMRSRKGIGWCWYPVYLWGIIDDRTEDYPDLWAVPQVEEMAHPGEKPVRVMEGIIRLVCPVGGLVVDPYCGSGSTLVAAQECGRDAVGIDNDEQWSTLAKERVA